MPIDPQKHALWAKYGTSVQTRHAEIARYLGFKGNTTAELVEALATEITKLGQDIDIQDELP